MNKLMMIIRAMEERKQGTILISDLGKRQGRKKVTLAKMVRKGFSEELTHELSHEG